MEQLVSLFHLLQSFAIFAAILIGSIKIERASFDLYIFLNLFLIIFKLIEFVGESNEQILILRMCYVVPISQKREDLAIC